MKLFFKSIIDGQETIYESFFKKENNLIKYYDNLGVKNILKIKNNKLIFIRNKDKLEQYIEFDEQYETKGFYKDEYISFDYIINTKELCIMKKDIIIMYNMLINDIIINGKIVIKIEGATFNEK